MSDGVHWVVPFAACAAPACREAIPTLELPRLQRLLARMTPGDVQPDTPDALSLPHERVLAAAHGLPAQDGHIPWAAWHVARSGMSAGSDAWAWITPCHWRVGSDHVAMQQYGELEITEEESRELLDAMRPFFEEDGVALSLHAPQAWLARGELFRELPTASPERVWGGVVDQWLPRVEAARPLRRLQQEMQMLLYTHPATDRAVAQRRLPVNSFWVSGAGALTSLPAGEPDEVRELDGLRESALRNDASAWRAAWAAVDAQLDPLLASVEAGQPARLTLCGEHAARTWRSEPGAWRRLTSMFSRPRLAEILEPL